MKLKHRTSYRHRRQSEYPPIEDQLDAFWKGGVEAERMREKVRAVKARHPKPNGENDSPT